MAVCQQEWNAETKKRLDSLLLNHAGHFFRNWVRSFVCAITKSRFVRVPKTGATEKYYRQLSRLSSALAVASDLAFLILGGGLKRRERLSARLGDVLSYLYLGSAALKYFDDFGKDKEAEAHMRWAAETCLYRAQEALLLLLDNFPTKNKWYLDFMVWKLRYTIFPFGRSYKKPSDDLEALLAASSLKPSEFRDKVTESFFARGDVESSEVALLEATFASVVEATPLYKKVREAVREGLISKSLSFNDQLKSAEKMSVLTGDEVRHLLALEVDRNEILQVDSFPVGDNNKMQLDWEYE